MKRGHLTYTVERVKEPRQARLYVRVAKWGWDVGADYFRPRSLAEVVTHAFLLMELAGVAYMASVSVTVIHALVYNQLIGRRAAKDLIILLHENWIGVVAILVPLAYLTIKTVLDQASKNFGRGSGTGRPDPEPGTRTATPVEPSGQERG